jgi:hypothetical protein
VDELQRITWFAGLFEGEGTFTFVHGKPKRLAISMTDKDVLDRVEEYFGGSVKSLVKRREHWKDAWIWSIYGENSVDLARKILPYLGERRARRCREYIEEFSTRTDRKKRTEELRQRVWELRVTGLTHQAIADIVGKDRTYVTHILNSGMVGVA